jgi:uncharacterized protein YcfJ
MASGAFSSSARRETSSVTLRGIRPSRSALAGGLLGALIAVTAFGLIGVATGGGSPWWWVAAAVAGGIGGLVVGALVAAEREDGESAGRRDLLSP